MTRTDHETAQSIARIMVEEAINLHVLMGVSPDDDHARAVDRIHKENKYALALIKQTKERETFYKLSLDDQLDHYLKLAESWDKSEGARTPDRAIRLAESLGQALRVLQRPETIKSLADRRSGNSQT